MPRQGKQLLDATCVPADIACPTDLSLLNEAREKLEQLIDVLHAPTFRQREEAENVPTEGKTGISGHRQAK
ncbi:MAG: hypothetical protein OWS03_10835 [Alicyclobacillaceae bacterium]|nr:hypothetical protein [Alicyclobacillaceae bacterium]